MSDPFDVFDPFEPLEAAEEPVTGGSAAGGSPVEDPAGDDAAPGAPEPAPEPRAARRWTAPATRPTPPPTGAQHTSAQARPHAQARPEAPTRPEAPARPDASTRPDASRQRLPTGADFEDALDAVLFGPRGSEGEPDPAVGSEDRGPGSVALVPDAGLAAFRAVARSELEAAVERLSARGHLASLADDLGQLEPAVVVRFRPNKGPLAAFGWTAREPARFELRLAVDLDDETQVVAGYTLGAPDAPFTLLARTRLSAVRSDWVAQRFVDFVRRVLGLD